MKTVYYTATSLDGFLATPDDSVAFLDEAPQPTEDSYTQFINGIGAVCMGSATYRFLLRHLDAGGDWPYTQPTWVFTRQDLPTARDADVRFVRGDVAQVHAEMIAAAAVLADVRPPAAGDMRPDAAKWMPLLVIVLAVAAAAALGSLAAIDAADEYGRLAQPSWAPPGWLFGPVWTVLYAGIAFAGWRIWLAGGWSTDMRIWTAQLAVNALWTPIFFAWGQRGLALVWILVLDTLVAALVWRTWRMGWPAWLLVPYLAWVLFATALNAAVWWMN